MAKLIDSPHHSETYYAPPGKQEWPQPLPPPAAGPQELQTYTFPELISQESRYNEESLDPILGSFGPFPFYERTDIFLPNLPIHPLNQGTSSGLAREITLNDGPPSVAQQPEPSSLPFQQEASGSDAIVRQIVQNSLHPARVILEHLWLLVSHRANAEVKRAWDRAVVEEKTAHKQTREARNTLRCERDDAWKLLGRTKKAHEMQMQKSKEKNDELLREIQEKKEQLAKFEYKQAERDIIESTKSDLVSKSGEIGNASDEGAGSVTGSGDCEEGPRSLEDLVESVGKQFEARMKKLFEEVEEERTMRKAAEEKAKQPGAHHQGGTITNEETPAQHTPTSRKNAKRNITSPTSKNSSHSNHHHHHRPGCLLYPVHASSAPVTQGVSFRPPSWEGNRTPLDSPGGMRCLNPGVLEKHGAEKGGKNGRESRKRSRKTFEESSKTNVELSDDQPNRAQKTICRTKK